MTRGWLALLALLVVCGYVAVGYLAFMGDGFPDSVYLAAMVVCVYAAAWSAGRPASTSKPRRRHRWR